MHSSVELVLPSPEQIAELRGAHIDRTLWEMERARRRLDAAIADVTGLADRTAHFMLDGHRTVKAWAMAVTNCSPAEALSRDRKSRLMRQWPELAEQYRNAEVGVAQVHELARVAANPRCGNQVAESGQVLVDAAKQLEFADFRTVTQRWEQLADADGAHRGHDASSEHRNVTIVETGGEFEIRGRVPAIHGTILREILDKFAEAEFHADWDAATLEHGTASKELLARSAAQRRADALLKIFETAAGAGIAGKPVDICVNLLIDDDQFQQHLRNQIDDTPVTIDPASVLDRRCETSDGVPVDPRQAVALAISGHVRRIVLDSQAVVTNAGRRKRLFDGQLRSILQSLDPRCSLLGCTLRAAISQLDHFQAYALGGPTDAANARIACKHHNLFKHRNGYQPHRAPDGAWQLHRPNGTPMQPPDAA
jgi:hypothetical protein